MLHHLYGHAVPPVNEKNTGGVGPAANCPSRASALVAERTFAHRSTLESVSCELPLREFDVRSVKIVDISLCLRGDGSA